MAENTRDAYKTSLKKFQLFRQSYKLRNVWPVPISHMILFVSACFEAGYAPSSISLYVSSISFQHKLNQWTDPGSSFLVRKMLEGCKRLKQTKDSRAPISFAILGEICGKLRDICYSLYETMLFKAVYTLAYFGLFRVGELVVTKQSQQHRALMLDDVVVENGNKALRIRLRLSKSSQTGLPVTVRLPTTADRGLCCVRVMTEYLKVRPTKCSFLFCHENGSPLTRSQFAHVLSKSLHTLGKPLRKYRTHSFRIGRATDLAAQGVSELAIQKMGRWSSFAYKRYIRL